jgi:hypothetical protein
VSREAISVRSLCALPQEQIAWLELAAMTVAAGAAVLFVLVLVKLLPL